MADRLRQCQLSSLVSVINFWGSATMLITSTVEICFQHLGRVEEMFFAARRSYASAVLGVLILSVRPSVTHTRALWLIQKTYRRYFYTTWKGNPCSQMSFFVQLCSSWHDFKWLKASRSPFAIAELLVRYSQVLVENRRFNLPHLYILPSGVTPLEFCRDLWHQKTTRIALLCGIKISPLGSLD